MAAGVDGIHFASRDDAKRISKHTSGSFDIDDSRPNMNFDYSSTMLARARITRISL